MPSPWGIFGGGGGVTAVTGTPPIASSGGTTPDISIDGVAVIPPLEYLRWIDVDTAVPLADQDGSIARPYATIQQAVDEAGATFAWCMLVSPAYAETVTSGIPLALFSPGKIVTVANVSMTSGAPLTVANVAITGTLTLSASALVVGTGLCALNTVTGPGGGSGCGLEYDRVNCFGAITGNCEIQFHGGIIGGSIDCLRFEADNCKLAATHIRSSALFRLSECSSISDDQILGCSAADMTIEGLSLVPGLTGWTIENDASDTLYLDGQSNYWLDEIGATIDNPGQAVITELIPATPQVPIATGTWNSAGFGTDVLGPFTLTAGKVPRLEWYITTLTGAPNAFAEGYGDAAYFRFATTGVANEVSVNMTNATGGALDADWKLFED